MTRRRSHHHAPHARRIPPTAQRRLDLPHSRPRPGQRPQFSPRRVQVRTHCQCLRLMPLPRGYPCRDHDCTRGWTPPKQRPITPRHRNGYHSRGRASRFYLGGWGRGSHTNAGTKSHRVRAGNARNRQPRPRPRAAPGDFPRREPNPPSFASRAGSEAFTNSPIYILWFAPRKPLSRPCFPLGAGLAWRASAPPSSPPLGRCRG
jgi:hypothetical protein